MNTVKHEIHFATYLAKLLRNLYKIDRFGWIQVNEVYMHVYTFLKSDDIYFVH